MGLSHGFCIQLASIRFPAARAQPNGAVAQLGERLICIQEVAGSIPTSSTSVVEPDRRHSRSTVVVTLGPVAQLVERTPDKGEVGSSTLPRPTKGKKPEVRSQETECGLHCDFLTPDSWILEIQSIFDN